MLKRFHLYALALALLALAGVAISCVSAKHEASVQSIPSPVWPPRPEAPRIRYVKSIASPADIGRSPSRWKRVVRFITGDSGERENLSKPFGVALDEAGNLCLTDTGNNTVCYCDLARRQWRRWGAA